MIRERLGARDCSAQRRSVPCEANGHALTSRAAAEVTPHQYVQEPVTAGNLTTGILNPGERARKLCDKRASGGCKMGAVPGTVAHPSVPHGDGRAWLTSPLVLPDTSPKPALDRFDSRWRYQIRPYSPKSSRV